MLPRAPHAAVPKARRCHSAPEWSLMDVTSFRDRLKMVVLPFSLEFSCEMKVAYTMMIRGMPPSRRRPTSGRLADLRAC